jgi:hypothetical protein
MNVLNCNICFSDARPELVNWPIPEVPGIVAPSVIYNYYYAQPYINLTDSWHSTVIHYTPPVSEPSVSVLLIVGLSIVALLAVFKRKNGNVS